MNNQPIMTNSIHTGAVAVTVDTSGAYNKFLTALETNIGKAQPGEIRIVLHADEDKNLYVPRTNNTKTRYKLFINTVDTESLRNAPCDIHQSMGMLLEDRVKTNGYYVVWESAHHIHLVPAPTGFSKPKRSNKGFGF